MEFTEDTLILKVGRFREADLWLKLATPRHGVITAFAFGGSKSRRRFMGCLDPLNKVLFRIKRGRAGYLTCEEGTLLRGHPGLRSHPGRLGIAANCIKFYESVFEGPDETREPFELLDSVLQALDAARTVPQLFPVLFRARVLFMQGYAPDLGACPRCGKVLKDSVAPVLMVEQGRVVCGECVDKPGHRIRLGEEALGLLSLVRTASPTDWLGVSPGPVARRRFYDAVDGYMRYHLGLAWDEGRFRRV